MTTEGKVSPLPWTGVLDEVAAERARQDRLWGEQNHDPQDYFAILSEEIGEVAKEVVEWRFNFEKEKREDRLTFMRHELVQAAAVAVAMIEAIDRRKR